MAKIRVYELARELNLQNKQLLEKLSEMNLEVGSHMSSLDDEAVAVIKSNLLGKAEESKVVEETRIKPTVIRRRRKAVAEPEVPAEPIETEASAPAPEADAVAVEETDTPEATIEVAEEAPAPKRRPKAKTKAEAAAKVIAPAPVETPEPELEAEAAPEATPEPEVAPEPEPTPEPETSETAADAAPPAEATEPPAAETPAATVKRGKADTPARIIKRAPVVPPKPRQPERTRRTPPATQAAKPAPTGARPERDDRKKKGRRGRTDGSFGDYPGPKKKISFRRKEVIEGSALYSRGGRKGRKGGKSKITTGQKTQITTAKAIKRRVKIDDTIALSELAKRMGIKASDMIRKLMGMGVMATVNQTIDFETATLVAAEFDYEVERASFEEEAIIRVSEDAPDQLAGRPPVVTIMGHVDHGKTSLLDVIRESSVTDTEAGGITQHIGAYTVSTDKGNITFLDTPGHEAFSAMRSRGAQVTDIVILVVAADDGVMPQTIEAINHAKAAEVPIIVAVNKIDKAGAEPDRVQRELAEAGLAPEDWGGDTIFMQVSAKTKSGISELLEMILLQSEMLELKANPDKLALGHVIEAKLDSGRGPVATVLVTDGTLKVGQPVVCGIHYGKLRAVSDDRGNPVTEAGPATPVEIIGLSGVPNAGDEMVALADEKDAKQVSQHRSMKQRSLDLAKTSRLSLENLFEHMKEGDIKDLNVVVKADVQGSIEAISDALAKLNNEEVKINVVHAATGTISESDVFLATGSNAIIIGFNVRPNAKVQALAQEEHVDMRFYNIIYNLIKDVQDAMVGMMASQFEERILGRAEVRQVFHIPKIGAIAGSYVTDGSFKRSQMLRLLRDGIIIYEGKNSSLRRFKDDVKEVQTGYECGIGIENFNDIKEGDTIECFYLEEIKPKIA